MYLPKHLKIKKNIFICINHITTRNWVLFSNLIFNVIIHLGAISFSIYIALTYYFITAVQLSVVYLRNSLLSSCQSSHLISVQNFSTAKCHRELGCTGLLVHIASSSFGCMLRKRLARSNYMDTGGGNQDLFLSGYKVSVILDE